MSFIPWKLRRKPEATHKPLKAVQPLTRQMPEEESESFEIEDLVDLHQAPADTTGTAGSGGSPYP